MFWQVFRRVIAALLGLAFIRIGIQHFVDPIKFDQIVPGYLGWPRFWTLLTGVIEVILGLGLLFQATLKKVSFCLVIFLIIVYLANLNMWVNDVPFNGTLLGWEQHVLRLMVQLLLISFFIWVVKCQK